MKKFHTWETLPYAKRREHYELFENFRQGQISLEKYMLTTLEIFIIENPMALAA